MSSISRRDFLNGIALTVAAGLTPAAQIAAEPTRYPPALTGLRGQHPGSYEVAHAQAWRGKVFAPEVLVPGEPPGGGIDDASRRLANGKPLSEFVAAFPISSASKAQLLALYDSGRDPLGGKTAQEKLEMLKRMSYRDYLVRVCGCSEEVANCFQGRTLGFFGLGCDAVPAADARELGYPGFDGLGLPGRSVREPYIYHFPDGNASLARLLVRSLVPEVAPGQTMDDVVLARFDYDKLDRSDLGVRIRLEATCVDVRHTPESVLLRYV